MAEESASQANNLEAVAVSRFGELSEAERRLMRAVSKGEFAYCSASKSDSDPSNDPATADSWGRERWIRADLVSWLCRDREPEKMVHAKGLRVHAARIVGELDLSFSDVASPLFFYRCQFADRADFMYVRVPILNLTGSWTRAILADGANVPGGVILRTGFFATGGVRLLGARIGTGLDCSGGRFENPGGIALGADGIEVGGSVRFSDHFFASGEVRLVGSQIRNELDCTGGTFSNPGRVALGADRANIGSTAFLSEKFCAEGEVRFLGARIGNNLECIGATFKNQVGNALYLDGIHVEGNVFLNRGFSAEGSVLLIGARVAGNLECDFATFRNAGRVALNAENATVDGHVFLREGFSADGWVLLFGAHVGGGVDCRRGAFATLNLSTSAVKGIFCWSDVRISSATRLDLTNATVGTLQDDPASWPGKGHLSLDGFTYGHISEGPTDTETRLTWLDCIDKFTLQPYRQLARVLGDIGDTRGARQVLYAMEDRRRRERDPNCLARVWSRILRWTIGYGQKSGRALAWLVGLTLMGSLIFGWGYLGGSIVPTDKEAYDLFEERGYPPDYFPQFNPLIYSLEHCFPFVNLGLRDRWVPYQAGSARVPVLHWRTLVWMRDATVCGFHIFRLNEPILLRLCLWLQVGLGWMLATLFVVGFTGIVKAA